MDKALAVNLIASTYEIGLDEPLTVHIDVENADSLFAFSFEFNYSPALFDIDTAAITSGDLIAEPYLVKYAIGGQVSVALGEFGNIVGIASGRACSIILTSKSIGTDLLYINSLHLIKSDGSFINEFNTLNVEPIEITVIE